MNQLLFIETFVLGSATIAAIYHLVLFIQQRDKFLMFYSIYLFTLATYIAFKLLSDNYDPFKPTINIYHYILEEVIQVSMVTVYVLFAAQTLEVVNSKSIVRTLMYAFFILSFVSIGIHISSALIYGPGMKSITEYVISRGALVSIATIALLFAWRIRTSTFQRTIIIGSLVYDSSGLLSIISFATNDDVLGLNGVEPYLVGCLLDIIIFSSALGYRLKTIADQKNELLKKESETQISIENTRSRIALNLHDDVGSILSSMSIYSAAARQAYLSGHYDRSNELIEKIGVNARETLTTMSDIVWTLNPVNDGGIKLFDKLQDFASSLFGSMQVDFDFKIDEHLLEKPLDMKVRQNVYLIYKEIINNCAKHSDATKVNVTINYDSKLMVLTIKDNGKGFDVYQMKHGNGLESIKSRARELGGILALSSNENGTNAILSIPLD